ncbi:transposase [Granulicatella sp. 19428wC4_WM01]|nr:transposase [Granulicatella sp. 19428wC4_WM01]TFU96274.1 hypothetical protein E4T68_01440 [Granulicatella sp. WM01]
MDEIILNILHFDIPELNNFAQMIINWRTEIINSFVRINGKRINSSIAESINSQLKTILFNTHGIRNHERRRKRLIYVINKDNFSF